MGSQTRATDAKGLKLTFCLFGSFRVVEVTVTQYVILILCSDWLGGHYNSIVVMN